MCKTCARHNPDKAVKQAAKPVKKTTTKKK